MKQMMAKAPSDILEADLWGALLPEIGSWSNFAKKGLDVDETWFILVNKTIHNKGLVFPDMFGHHTFIGG